MKIRNIILLVLLLVIIDQGVKLIIYHSFMDNHYEIIPKVLDFKPFFNSKYSYLNDSIHKRTGLDAGLIFHIILFALTWLILFVPYRFFKSIAPTNKMLDVSFSFFTAAVICAYLGILVWEKGILDFLHLKLLVNFIFELKDLYVNCFLILLLISAKKIEAKHKIELKDMVDYTKGLFKKNTSSMFKFSSLIISCLQLSRK